MPSESAVINRTSQAAPPVSALITGASKGIGRVFAERLAREGYTVTCVARDEKQLKDLLAEIGEPHQYIVADLTDPVQLGKVVQAVKNNKYQLVINNAGYAVYDRFENVSLKRHENIIQLNIEALVKLSYAFLQTAGKGDALLNVSSALSRVAFPGGAVYCGTKGFVTNFTESLWYEYKDKGILVMAVLPGMTKTNFHHVALGDRAAGLYNNKTCSPELVVEETLQALRARNNPSLITGWRYRVLIFLATRILSRKRMIQMMGRKSPGLGK